MMLPNCSVVFQMTPAPVVPPFLRFAPVADEAIIAANMAPPKAPTAAASEGVESPNTIEPSTARISRASGKNEPTAS